MRKKVVYFSEYGITARNTSNGGGEDGGCGVFDLGNFRELRELFQLKGIGYAAGSGQTATTDTAAGGLRLFSV